ncbi:MAG: MSHA biogenesis protein MshK [Rhodocyclales bacterium]|nr:MSHA biogenesis protein MshK [Rhodocyclales bacterium]MBI5784246.1 MSHA biogenesis protein MshK [Rhodocyclales bacterium]
MNAKRSVLLLLALAGTVHAQGLPDPTRPPVLLEGEPAATAAPSGLQSIIRRDKGKSAAVINGQYVELGGKVGDARLERIGEDFVVLRSASGRETMYLTPGIGKKKAKP